MLTVEAAFPQHQKERRNVWPNYQVPSVDSKRNGMSDYII
jgi:hypothetical protein